MKALLLSVIAALLILPAAARALPGDSPVVPRSPADGATVPANADGVPVAFDCPDYKVAVYEGGGNTITDFGDEGDYDVRFSDKPAIGSDGRLASHPYGSDASARRNADGSTCTALLDTYDTSSSPEIVGGTIYWQASRYCNGCGGNQREFAPVQSFKIRPASIKATLKAPRRPYAGYLNVYTLQSDAELSGAKVVLQRQAGKRWKTVDKQSYRLDGTDLFAKLPGGSQKLRARIQAGGTSFTAAAKEVRVRMGGRRKTSKRDDGAYKAHKQAKNSTLKFKVGGGGRTLKKFKASVTTFCFGPTFDDNKLFLGFAQLKPVKIAPDGSVVGLLETKKGGRALLTGKLRNRRFKGKVSLSFSTCSGTRKGLDAVRR